MSDLTLQLVTSLKEFEALEKEWDDFAVRLGPDAFFGRYAFARANLEISMTGRRDSFMLYLVRKGAELMAVAPLLRRSGPPGFFSLVWMESRTSLYAAFSMVPEYEAEVFELHGKELVSHVRLRKFQSDYVPLQSALARFFEHLGADQSRVAPNTEVKLDQEVIGSLNRKRRSSIRRLERRLGELGTLEHRTENAREHVDEVTNWIFDRKLVQFQSDDGSNWIEWPETRTYFNSVVGELSQSGAARTGELLLDGKRVAASLFFLADRRIWFSKTAYDPEYAHYSPGWIEVVRTLEAFRQEGFVEVDLMLGEGLIKSSLGRPGLGTCRYRLSLNPLTIFSRRMR